MPFDAEAFFARLDADLAAEDYAAAEARLADAHREALAARDLRLLNLIENEQMGLYRRLGRGEEALDVAKCALGRLGLTGTVGLEAATTRLNAATVLKSLGKNSEALSLYEAAREPFERCLSRSDPRLAALYNNTATTLAALARYREAYELYSRALSVLSARDMGRAEAAMTYLNIAEAIEAERGALDGEADINSCLDRARELLDTHPVRDVAYAFACEKCAPTFLYYGRFAYAAELTARGEAIRAGY